MGRRVGVIAVACAALIAWMGSVPGATAASSGWKVVATPDLGANAKLLGVACPDSSTCFAVGVVDRFRSTHSVIERWDGRRWKRVANPHLDGDELLAVSCVDATHCVAVGQRADTGAPSTLIEVWDGEAWTVEAGPSPSYFWNELTSVSCASSTSCAAVGYGFDMHANGIPIVANYDGSTWTGGYGPGYNGISPKLFDGVSCPNVTRCIGVGETDDSAGMHEYVGEWNGHEWSERSTNVAATKPLALGAVTCRSAHTCIAVGHVGHRPLVEVRQGSVWSIEPSADPGVGSDFEGVACPTRTRCVAVGRQGPWSRRHDRPLVETARGSTWTLVPAPLVGEADALRSVACTSVDVCFAVGETKTAGASAPLVLSGPA